MNKAIISLVVLTVLSSALGQTAPRAAARGRGAAGRPMVYVDPDWMVLDDETGKPVEQYAIQPIRTSPDGNGGYVSGVVTISRNSPRPGGRYGARVGYFAGDKLNYRILADGYAAQTVLPAAVEIPGNFAGLTVRLKRGATVRGTVVDSTGKPVEGARVMIGGYLSAVLLVGSSGMPTTRPDTTGNGGVKTDAQGRFTLTGYTGAALERIWVMGPDNTPQTGVYRIDASKEQTIRFPEPATLVLDYDIPGADADSAIRLERVGTVEPQFRNLSIAYDRAVKNQSQLEWKGLTPGTYDISRQKVLPTSASTRAVALDKSDSIVLAPGQTTRISWVRKKGFPIRGEVIGIGTVNPNGGYVYVRPQEATGDTTGGAEAQMRLFDAQPIGLDGQFQTALLEPGTYTLVAIALAPNAGPAGVYVGVTKVTITEDAPPDTALMTLKQRPDPRTVQP